MVKLLSNKYRVLQKSVYLISGVFIYTKGEHAPIYALTRRFGRDRRIRTGELVEKVGIEVHPIPQLGYQYKIQDIKQLKIEHACRSDMWYSSYGHRRPALYYEREMLICMISRENAIKYRV